ncbi:fimbrial biogenesis outer membrane usher protein [Salmonella enterica subsp. enterica serovar Java]|nr:fimbrial biogenesis outer membrane usher protein [Salmonella enterica subsp. enterica serovar Oranienburg]EBV8363749.1 fimbrial biogenesis outer membrane usher protein [Salmonella enterica subsp. enterica serovar Java]EBV8393108.1 fimbrial biogenesis outer membrane usher protein [Salmonella enterica subsp. enterica serovar Virchow]EDV5629308.1 fimbrial biogenesis outer membrane usher protein [Salmonella enterica subsp. enterica]EFU9023147.1 fimbrial biogenesis outer membrane usher protein [S
MNPDKKHCYGRQYGWLQVNIFSLLLLGYVSSSYAESVPVQKIRFSPEFFKIPGVPGDPNLENTDLSLFEEKGGQLPGDYLVDVMVNGQPAEKITLKFLASSGKPGLFACLTTGDLTRWGIRQPVHPEKLCSQDIADIFPEATEKLDLNKRQLLLSIPQQELLPPGWLRVPAALWDEGIPAAMINYDYSGGQQSNEGSHTSSQYLGLNGSLNLMGWRLRNQSNWTEQRTRRGVSTTQWSSLNTYLQHDYASGQGGMFTLGQTYTNGDLFDSFAFEGIKAESDDGMLNATLAGYSPVIRGIATTQAQVIVRQNGSIIYQKNVAPGPFEFRDVSAFTSGDVQVEVHEADGSINRFTQASGAVPVLQREGRVRYSVAAGRYRQDGVVQGRGERPDFLQGTAAWGLPAEFTVYGGVQASEHYTAAMLGGGRFFPVLGALSVDVTQARAQFDQDRSHPGNQQGQAFRFAWSRGFDTTGTSLSLAGYRYATSGFYTFSEMQQFQQGEHNSNPDWQKTHLRSRIQFTLSQPVGWNSEFGQVSLSGSQDSYWNEGGSGQNWTTTYSTTIAPASIGISLGYSKTPRYGSANKTAMFNISVPLSGWLPDSSLTSNFSTRNSRTSLQTGVSGSVLSNQLNYSVSQGWQNQGQGATGNASATYLGRFGQVNGGYSYYQNGHQWLYGLSGGVTVHPHGVTLSQKLSLDGGNALVIAPGAKGVKVSNGTGISTDWSGYALVPNLSSYQHNNVALDVSDLPDDVDAKNTDINVVPTRGALVAAPFKVSVGYRALITLRYSPGVIPLGAAVVVKQDKEVVSQGIVDNGQVYLSGLPETGTLEVTWQNGAEHHCQAGFHITPSETGLNQITAVCR